MFGIGFLERTLLFVKGPSSRYDQYWFFFDIPNHMLLCHAAQYIFSLKALLLSHFQIIQEKSQFPQSKAFIDRSFPATLEFKKTTSSLFFRFSSDLIKKIQVRIEESFQ